MLSHESSMAATTQVMQPSPPDHNAESVLKVQTPDKDFNHFVNNLLPRQILGEDTLVGGLSSHEAVTHESLQSILGMCFLRPDVARQTLLTSVAQLPVDGTRECNDGSPEPKLADNQGLMGHSVWLPIALDLYLSETADYSVLDASVAVHNSQGQQKTVFDQMCLVMDTLFASRDKYGLNYIGRGDWLASLDRIGHKGGGVSGWITVATVYALGVWSRLCARHSQDSKTAERYAAAAAEVKKAAMTHLWDGEWFLRGITDDGVLIGTNTETEGRIWLDVQSWAILSGVATPDNTALLLPHVEAQLGRPEVDGGGMALCAPSYSNARDDVGSVTEDPVGSTENGGRHRLATIWHAYSLYSIGRGDSAFGLLQSLSSESAEAQEAYAMDRATASWTYRTIVEGLFGLSADSDGLSVSPQLPSDWTEATVNRRFRGATFDVSIKRASVEQTTISVDGNAAPMGRITNIEKGRSYKVQVLLPL